MGTAMFHVKQTGTEPPRLGISNVEAWDKTDPDPNKKDPTPSPKAVIRLSQGGKPADHSPMVSLGVSRETSNVRVQMYHCRRRISVNRYAWTSRAFSVAAGCCKVRSSVVSRAT